jgi:phage baseplate assembly protein gpV
MKRKLLILPLLLFFATNLYASSPSPYYSDGTNRTTYKINRTGNYVELSSSGQTGDHTFTFPDATDEVVTKDATQTLTNKTISGNLEITGTLTLSGQSGARGYGGSAQLNLTSGTSVKVVLDTESNDILGEFDSTTNYRFTATQAGYYDIDARITWQGGTITADKLYAMYLYINGAGVHCDRSHASTGADGYGLSNSISDTIYLAVNDYVEIYAYAYDGTGTADLDAGTGYRYLTINKKK